jgi:hypothetical protein
VASSATSRGIALPLTVDRSTLLERLVTVAARLVTFRANAASRPMVMVKLHPLRHLLLLRRVPCPLSLPLSYLTRFLLVLLLLPPRLRLVPEVLIMLSDDVSFFSSKLSIVSTRHLGLVFFFSCFLFSLAVSIIRWKFDFFFVEFALRRPFFLHE